MSALPVSSSLQVLPCHVQHIPAPPALLGAPAMPHYSELPAMRLTYSQHNTNEEITAQICQDTGLSKTLRNFRTHFNVTCSQHPLELHLKIAPAGPRLSPTRLRQKGSLGFFSFICSCSHITNLQGNYTTPDQHRCSSFSGKKAARDHQTQEFSWLHGWHLLCVRHGNATMGEAAVDTHCPHQPQDPSWTLGWIDSRWCSEQRFTCWEGELQSQTQKFLCLTRKLQLGHCRELGKPRSERKHSHRITQTWQQVLGMRTRTSST